MICLNSKNILRGLIGGVLVWFDYAIDWCW